jgi:hypothetical protein
MLREGHRASRPVQSTDPAGRGRLHDADQSHTCQIGTIQPGVIWAGQYFQIGAEAIIPANRFTGHGYGGVFQLHFYLDDLFPRSIGKPISEWW